ncbi:MAG: beta/gamma crystallin-related protein [Pyrinomonadaceae bacterium]
MKIISCFVYGALVMAAIGEMVVCSAQERQMGGVGITVFTDRDFRGKSSTFRQDVTDLQPTGLNDKVSSLRVGPGEQWEICEHSNYQGRCVVVSGDEADLRRNSWNDVISSLRRVNAGPAPPTPGDLYIVLFDRTIFRGNPTNYNGATADLGNNNRRAQSVTIGRGAWELCEGTNFTGRCVTLERSVADLIVYKLRNRVSSVRPIRAGGPPTPPPADWYIVLFDQPTYRGNPTNYNAERSNLNKKAQSVTIGRGVWEICEGRNFQGHCVTLDQSVPDLRSYNFRGHVRSVRPIRPQPR